MKKDLYLQVPTPCHENWNAMQPGTEGRFCAACAKTVVDFSMMTDNEVLHYLESNTGKICGRFHEEQLERPLVETQLQPKKTWRYWLASAASVLALVNKGQAQQKSVNSQHAVSNVTETYLTGDIIFVPTTMRNPATVTGFVGDEKGKAIVGASVIVTDTHKGVATDSNGTFHLTIPTAKTEVVLSVSYIGYESKEVTVNIKRDRSVLVTLHERLATLGEVSVIGHGTATIRCTMGGVSTRMGGLSMIKVTATSPKLITPALEPSESLVYPNPAPKGSQVHVQLKEAGTHTIQLLDNQSRPLLLKQATVTDKDETVLLSIPYSLPSAYYYIRIINEETKKQVVSKLLVQ